MIKAEKLKLKVIYQSKYWYLIFNKEIGYLMRSSKEVKKEKEGDGRTEEKSRKKEAGTNGFMSGTRP